MSDKKIQEKEAKKVDENIEKEAKKKVKFLLSPCGKFLLPYNVGQIVELEEKKAKEIVEAKYAEYVQ